MPQAMSISVNGQSQVPPGFRFHPTEEELLNYYLRKKVSYETIDLDVIRDVDLNKLEPWDIQEKCKIGSTPQNDWYFFSHKDKKYPTGTRTNRATAAGFWKATGRDKVIYSNCKRIGMRKTLVFYKGRAPHGQKSDWIMHEYRLDDNTIDTNVYSVMGEMTQEEGWVVCRIFRKKNFQKVQGSPSMTANSRNRMISSSDDGAFNQILEYMGRSNCKEENETIHNNTRNFDESPHGRFMKLPSLESPNDSTSSSQACYVQLLMDDNGASFPNQVGHDPNSVYHSVSDWADLDRLVASHLNGPTETSKQLACLSDPTIAVTRSHNPGHDYSGDMIDLWSFVRSSSSCDTLCHLSNARV